MRRWLAILVLAGGSLAVAIPGAAAPPDSDGPGDPAGVDEPDDPGVPDDPVEVPESLGVPGDSTRRPLVEVPSGCVESPLPDVVFVGSLVDRDFRTGRFQIGQVRAGDPSPFAGGGLIDVRYGLDVQYLDLDETYLVSARRDPVLGVLASRIRPEPPLFGGDDIIGLVESEVECPGFEDPARTLHPDGSVVEASLVGPLLERRTQLLGAMVLPFAVAFGLVFVVASLRLSIAGVLRGVGAAAARRWR